MSEQDHPTVDMPVVNAPVFEAPLPGADVARYAAWFGFLLVLLRPAREHPSARDRPSERDL